MIDPSKRVYVYYNLHKKCWSVKQSGKVVSHTDRIALRDARYLVGKAGRKRVLATKTKNVHAGVSGYVVDRIPTLEREIVFYVTYNPYKYDSFVDRIDREPVDHSDYAYLECGDGWRDIEAIFDIEYWSKV